MSVNRTISSETLRLPTNPTEALDAATKQYVDAVLASKVTKTGDTMTGTLVLDADPLTDLEAATKHYVDDRILNGPIAASSVVVTPTGAIAATNAQAALAELDSEKVAKGGDTMTGLLTLAGDPTTNYQAATKIYVDKLTKSANETYAFTDVNQIVLAYSTHGMTKKPNVTTVTADGVEIIGEVSYAVTNGDYTVTINFNHNQTGLVILT
jgi:hypothetical protein